MAFRSHEDAIRIFGIDEDGGDLLRVAQAEMLPRLAGVGGFVDAITGREIRALETFAAPDIKNIGVGWRDGNRADRAGRLVVENGIPRVAGVGCLPNASVHCSHIEDIRLVRGAGDGDGAAAAERPDAAPAHLAIKFLTVLLRALRKTQRERGN